MSQENDLLLQFQMIKATFRDHQKTVPFPSQIMFGWAIVSAILIFGTPSVLKIFSFDFITTGLFYLVVFALGITAEYLFIKGANEEAGINLSPTQKYILKVHGIGGFFGILMTLIFVQYAIIELLYIFWIFWIGLAVFITGFLTKGFILKIGVFMMGTGIAGLIILICLKALNFVPMSKESFFDITMMLSFLAITLTHVGMGLRLKKEAYV